MLHINRRKRSKRNLRWLASQTDSKMTRRLLRPLYFLLILLGLHTVAMLWFEGMTFADAFWVTWTTVTTVGYGDYSAQTWFGRTATIVLLYVGGIGVVAHLAGEYIEFLLNRRERKIKGRWRWNNMQDHIVIVNVPEQDPSRYLRLLVEQIRCTPSLADMPVHVLTEAYDDGMPVELRELGIVHTHGQPSEEQLRIVNVNSASIVLVLAANTIDHHWDSVTLDVLVKLSDIGTSAYTIVECVDDHNQQRFRRFGANAVLRPMRAYPELVVRAMADPGTEQVLENLFTHNDNHPRRYDIDIQGMNWSDIACTLVKKDLGLPLGYVDKEGTVFTNPRANKIIDAQALIMVVDYDSEPDIQQIRDELLGGT